jgi:hypothetical protein
VSVTHADMTMDCISTPASLVCLVLWPQLSIIRDRSIVP